MWVLGIKPIPLEEQLVPLTPENLSPTHDDIFKTLGLLPLLAWQPLRKQLSQDR